MTCPRKPDCPFFRAINPHVMLRIKYAQGFPFCRNGLHPECEIHRLLEIGLEPPKNLTPWGDFIDYDENTADEGKKDSVHRILLIEPSAVFRSILVNTIEHNIPNVLLRSTSTFDELQIRRGDYDLIISEAVVDGIPISKIGEIAPKAKT